MPPTQSMLETVQQQLGDKRKVQIAGESLLIGAQLNNPRTGDIRITFSTETLKTLTAVGLLNDGKLSAFETSNGRKISLFQAGEISATEMFDDAISGNNMLTWGLRVAGFVGMLIGFKMLFSVIGVLGDVIPFFGDILRFATGLFSFALTAIISTLVIGFAWIYFRPMLGMLIIAVGIVLAVIALILGKAKAKARASVETGEGAAGAV